MTFSQVAGPIGVLIVLLVSERRFMKLFDTGGPWWAFLPLVPVAGSLTGLLVWSRVHDPSAPPQSTVLQLMVFGLCGISAALLWIGIRLGLRLWRHRRRFLAALADPHHWPADARVRSFRDPEHMETEIEFMEQACAVRYLPMKDRPDGEEPWFEDWIHHDEPAFQAPLYLIVPMQGMLRRRRGATPNTFRTMPRNSRTAVFLVQGEGAHPAAAFALTEHRKALAVIEAM